MGQDKKSQMTKINYKQPCEVSAKQPKATIGLKLSWDWAGTGQVQDDVGVPSDPKVQHEAQHHTCEISIIRLYLLDITLIFFR